MHKWPSFRAKKSFNEMLEGRGQPDNLVFNDLDTLREFAEGSIRGTYSTAKIMAGDANYLPPKDDPTYRIYKSFIDEPRKNFPPESEWAQHGIYRSLEDMFGSVNSLYEAVFELRMRAIVRVMQGTALGIVIAAFSAVGWWLMLREARTADDIDTVQWVAGSIFAIFIPLVAIFPAFIFYGAVGGLAALAAEGVLIIRRHREIAEAWRKFIF